MKSQLQLREEQLAIALQALEFYILGPSGLTASDAMLRIRSRGPLPVVQRPKL